MEALYLLDNIIRAFKYNILLHVHTRTYKMCNTIKNTICLYDIFYYTYYLNILKKCMMNNVNPKHKQCH